MIINCKTRQTGEWDNFVCTINLYSDINIQVYVFTFIFIIELVNIGPCVAKIIKLGLFINLSDMMGISECSFFFFLACAVYMLYINYTLSFRSNEVFFFWFKIMFLCQQCVVTNWSS